jgi:hypothetical protein
MHDVRTRRFRLYSLQTRSVILPRPDTRLDYRGSDFESWSDNREKFPATDEWLLSAIMSRNVRIPSPVPCFVTHITWRGPTGGGGGCSPVPFFASCLRAQRSGIWTHTLLETDQNSITRKSSQAVYNVTYSVDLQRFGSVVTRVWCAGRYIRHGQTRSALQLPN